MRQLKIATQITNRDSQAVEKYLQDISRIPMITAEEETVLAQKIRSTDNTVSKAALEKMVKLSAISIRIIPIMRKTCSSLAALCSTGMWITATCSPFLR